jgi:predicted Rossmann fold nucleotide-binding protein DprA/Smf involved in DNA uptake
MSDDIQLQVTVPHHIIEELMQLAVPDNAQVAQEMVRDFFLRRGYQCELEFHVSYYSNDGTRHQRHGRIDLLVREPQGRHADIAIEIDRRRPRARSIQKLLLLNGVIRMVLLRGGKPSSEPPGGIHYILGLPTLSPPSISEPAVASRHASSSWATQHQQNRLYETYQQRIRRTYSRAYDRWTPEEEERLERLAQEGKTHREIGLLLGRRPDAVRSRLDKITARRQAAHKPEATAGGLSSQTTTITLEPQYIAPGNDAYPKQIAATLRKSPTVNAIGNIDILKRNCLGLFCSRRVPDELVLKVSNLSEALRAAGIAVIGGFHTPTEKECLRTLLGGSQPVIACPPRSIERMRMPREWLTPIADGRLLVVSPFSNKHLVATNRLAEQRNRFVAAVADTLLVAYADPGGRTERLCREALAWGKPIYTLRSLHNDHLVRLGATPIEPDHWRS